MSAYDQVILLVEDNPDDIELTLRAIKASNVANDVVVVGDGDEALDFLFARGTHSARDDSDLPLVVLLDLNLPTVEGLDVLAQIRSDPKTHRLPVVVLTSSRHDQDMVESETLGVTSYVQKPLDFADFHDALERVGLRWMILRRTTPEA